MKKGYIDTTNVILTNKKFKKFKYSDEEKEFCVVGEELKLNALSFFKIIEFFYKIPEETIILDGNKNFLKMSNKSGKISIELPLIYPPLIYPIREISGVFSVEYLFYWLKEFKIKELEDEFIYLNLKKDSPLTIKFNEDWGILAPKVLFED